MGIQPQKLTKQAASALRDRKGGRSVTALRLALACLEDEDSGNLVAFLVPIEGELTDADGLAKRLQQVQEEDNDELAELLKDVLAGQNVLPSDPQELFRMLATIRHDKPELMQLLARALGIPSPLQDREYLKRELQDQLSELELTTEGAREDTRLRAAGIAAERNDPNFLPAFEEVSAVEKTTWVQQMQALLRHYPIQALPNALLNLIKALGDEMQVVRDDSEKIRLGLITGELQKAYEANSLLYGLKALRERLLRIIQHLSLEAAG